MFGLGITKISEDTFDLLSALEAASLAIGAAQTPGQINVAYSHLSVCRASVYSALSRIERQAKVEQNISLRF